MPATPRIASVNLSPVLDDPALGAAATAATVADRTPPAPPPRAADCGSEFAPLMRQVRESGLLEPRNGYYVSVIAGNLALILLTGAAIAAIGDSWWQLALAVPTGLLSTRCGFIGHDAGHQQLGRSRRVNRLVGLIHGNLLIGLSLSWWVDKHNRHHANPNHVGKDPDVAIGALVWTSEQAATRRGLVGWVTRHQAWLFFPMLMAEGVALKVVSLISVLRRPRGRHGVETVLLVTHLVAYFSVLFYLMSPGKAVLFILVHQAVFGVHLGCAFAPNHKGMPMPPSGERWGHLARQVRTSRNIRGGAVTDWVLGGLNYQIEHHLFPSIPRANLRRAQPMVRAYCAEVGLKYTECGLWSSYTQVLRHLYRVGAPLRCARSAVSDI